MSIYTCMYACMCIYVGLCICMYVHLKLDTGDSNLHQTHHAYSVRIARYFRRVKVKKTALISSPGDGGSCILVNYTR
jgi:hypothetical protein